MHSHIYLSLGSNSGDRHAMIGRAVAAISEFVSTWKSTVRVAEPITGAPVGFDSPHPFVNVGLCISGERDHEWTSVELLLLLDAMQNIERSISTMPHRNPDGTYRDREIDIDIIGVDDVVFHHPRLVLPHPKAAVRPFVLRPLATLEPEWRHPVLQKTASELLADLEKAGPGL